MYGLSPRGLLLAIVAILFVYTETSQAQRRVVCYYTNWPQYRRNGGKYVVSDVDAFDCTHLVFAFGRVVKSNIEKYEWNDLQSYRQFTGLKSKNPYLVTLLAVGGWNHGPDNFTEMASTKTNREIFIENSIQLLREYNFDGLDLDWEYPGKKEPMDKVYLSSLLQEMDYAYRQESVASGRKKLLISMAVAAGIKNAEKGYQVSVLDRYLDMYNIMAYDFHGAWESFTGLASPLESDTDSLSVAAALEWWMHHGASPSKINLGLSFYARSWTLATPGDGRLGAQADKPGKKGFITKEDGALSYYEVCRYIKQGMRSRFDLKGKVMYGVLDDQFVTYETIETLSYKLDYIVKKNLGGAMVWSLDHDDFNGEFCGQGRKPLLTVVKKAMMTKGGGAPRPVDPINPRPPVYTQKPPVYTQRPPVYTQRPPVYTQRPPVYTQRPPVYTQRPPLTQRPPVVKPNPQPNPNPKVCYKDGYPHIGIVADPSSCHHFFLCSRGGTFSRERCRMNEVVDPDSGECGPRSDSNPCTPSTG